MANPVAVVMEKELYVAATKGNVGFLLRKDDGYLLKRTHEQNNIIHIAIRHKQINFIEACFIRFTKNEQICTNAKGNNPLHVAAEMGNMDILSLIYKYIEERIEEIEGEKPWRVQNLKGNTPLHVAIIHDNVEIARFLLEKDPSLACTLNNSSEAPLHLAIKQHANYWKVHFSNEDIETMVKADAEAAFQLDQDRLTPLLRAFQSGNIFTGATLCSLSPEAAKIRDGNGYTFWHYVVNHPSNYYVFRLIKQEAFRDMLRFKDNNGDTLLHLAIRGNRFDLVKEFLDIWVEKDQKKENKDSSNGKKDKWLVELLNIDNKAGKTPADLIAESACLPSNIEKGILGETEMIGVLSVWGIPSREMKTYVNTIGIIAALLTTITFTAAFTVPGGIIQDNNGILGTPVLIEKVAFQIFMISDIIAMCLSMMVLCCLLWVMATSKRHNSVMILDFSLSLLIASFFATLVTFMTGLYATTFPVKPWIAIITLVLCSVLMLLVHKFIVTKLLIPFRNAINVFFTWKFLQSVTGLPTKTNTSNNPGVTAKENTRPGPRINA